MTRSKPRVADRGNGCWRYKPYPEYRGSGIAWLGEIPAHWEVKRLRFTVTRCENGIWGDEPDGENDVACVRVADFDRTTHQVRIDSPTWRAVNPQIVSARRLGRDDLLLEKSGGGEKQPVGVVVRNTYPGPAVCSNFIARMPVAKSYHVGHLTYLHAALYSARINSRSIKQSIGIQNLDSKSYLNEFVALPKKSEQAAIAEFLDRETGKIDALVAKKERLIELLKEKRIALITQAVTRGLAPDAPMRDSCIDWLGRIPEHWNQKRLKFFVLFRTVKINADAKRATYIGLENIEPWTGRLLLDNLLESTQSSVTQFQAGDVLFGKLRPYLAKAACPDFIGVSTSELLVLRPEGCLPRYLLYLFLNQQYVRWINGLTYGTRMPRVSPEQVGDSFAPLPPLEEQQAIAEFLDRETAKIDALVDKVREAIERLKELRTTLISAAVTGRIDVREAAA